MGLVVIPAPKGHMRQTRSFICDKATCTLETKNPSVGLRWDAYGISKALAEVSAAITGIIRELFHRNGAM